MRTSRQVYGDPTRVTPELDSSAATKPTLLRPGNREAFGEETSVPYQD